MYIHWGPIQNCQFYERLKCSTQNIKFSTAQYSTVSDKQSVKQVQTIADVQNVLVLECAWRRGRHCLTAQSMIFWSNICHSSTGRYLRWSTSFAHRAVWKLLSKTDMFNRFMYELCYIISRKSLHVSLKTDKQYSQWVSYYSQLFNAILDNVLGSGFIGTRRVMASCLGGFCCSGANTKRGNIPCLSS